MIGLDTNVLVRYIAQDDPKQSPRATRLIETQLSASQPGFVSLVVLVELCWVLKRLFAATPAERAKVVEDLLAARQLQVERRDLVMAALQTLRGSKADIADALIARIAADAGCAEMLTFDKAAARLPGVTLLV